MAYTNTFGISALGVSITALSLAVLGAAPTFAGTPPTNQLGSDAAEVEVTSDTVVLDGPGGSFDLLTNRDQSTESLVEIIDSGTAVRVSTAVLSASDASVEYPLDLPAGSTAEVMTNDEGQQSVLLKNALGELLGGVAPQPTLDANGAPVQSVLRLEGSTVVQQVTPSAESAAFPLTLAVASSTVWYNNAWVHLVSQGYIVNADPTALGRQQIAWNTHSIHVEHVKSILGSALTSAYWNWNIEQQFVCHVVGAWFPSGVYNMESWQPALAWGLIANPIDRCNRIK